MTMFLFVACDDDDDDDPVPTATPTSAPPTPTMTPTPTPTPQQQAFFAENFDSYEAGSYISGQGGWEIWGGSSDHTYDAVVSNGMSASSPNSLEMGQDSDIVHQFSGANAGMWYAKINVYVPDDQTGELLFIMLNQYGATNNWSAQIRMSKPAGTVASLGGTGFSSTATLPLITGQWVPIRLEIDLQANLCTIFYNNEQLDQTVWQSSGANEIAAIDLFSNKSSIAWYDDFSLDTNP